MRKWLTYIGIFISVITILFMSWLYTGERLPADFDKQLPSILEKEIPQLVTGTTGFVTNDGVKIWYEYKPTTIDTSLGTVLLVMGHSSSGLLWTPSFYDHFLDAGYNVIRYDNRGTGKSDWMKDWEKSSAYDLKDMASDAISIVRHLDIPEVHIVGVSMGGMIAQEIAIHYPEYTRSLASIMSSGYMNDPELTLVTPNFMLALTKISINYLIQPSEKDYIKFNVAIADILNEGRDQDYDADEIALRTRYQLAYHNGFNPNVQDQHSEAIKRSGSRYEALKSLSTPTVVIHGTSDPLVLPEHSKTYAPLIPDAQMVWIDGMGHDIPNQYIPQVTKAIMQNMYRS